MKKTKQILFYIFGVQVLALGISFLVRANLGVSVGTSVSYVLSHHFDFFTLGVWNYIHHGCVMLLLIALTRTVKPTYFISFLTSVFLGYSIDLFDWLLQDAAPSGLMLQIVCALCGVVCVGVGISMNLVSGFPAAPFDMFSSEISAWLKQPLVKVKTIFDFSCLGLAILFGFLFFGRMMGIGIGTLLSALFTGAIIGFSTKRLARFVE